MDTWFRKHDPRKPKDPSEVFAFKGGTPLAVLRPENPALTLEGLAKVPDGTPHEVAKPMLDALFSQQPHQFVGYMSRKGEVIDKWGRVIGQPQPGDDLCWSDEFEPPMFMQTGRFHTEVCDGRTGVVLPNSDLKRDSSTGIIIAAPDPKHVGGVALRGGIKEPDCHIPTLNRMIHGDPDKAWNATA